MQPPEVKGTSEGITNWLEFERWAGNNLPIWNNARHYCAVVGMVHGEYLKLVAYHLTIENQKMKDALVKHAQENGRPLYFP